MSNCQIRFQFNKVDVVIPCKKDELMKDIIVRYGIKSKLSIEEFYFLYEGYKINPELTFAQINEKDKEIFLLVFPNKNEGNENKIEKSNYIKCVQCNNPAIVEFLNDYWIILSDEKHKTKKIKLLDYTNTQMVDQSKIKCSKCSKSKANIYQDKFFYCFECNKIFCTICKSLHKNHKNIVDYSLKYFRCHKHKDQNFISYCLNCKKNICIICNNQHKEHEKINLKNLYQEKSKEYIIKIEQVKNLVDRIIDSLQKFKKSLDCYVQINLKLNENLLNMNLNYQNIKSMKNFIEMSFLKKDIDQILNSTNINEKFQKIMSMYGLMNGTVSNNDVQNSEIQIKKYPENINEIAIKVIISQCDENKAIYFLDNTQESDGSYFENNRDVKHNHDNLREINENNTTLIIEGKTVPFKKSFIPTKSGIYSIKLLFKNKLSNCAYLFCQCKDVIDIDFSKFNTENVTDMKYMFYNCSFLTSVNLSSFNTENVKDMKYMFSGCKRLKSLGLKSFNTLNVTTMRCMFYNCISLTNVCLYTFNTQKVTDMEWMFGKCSSLITLNLSSFNTKNCTTMKNMFSGCSSLTSLNLSSFNPENVKDMGCMFQLCSSLTAFNFSSFNTQKVTDMNCMFYGCSSLTSLNLSSFNTQNVNSMYCMFAGCSSLTILNLSSFNTCNVTNMRCMFSNCSSLSILNLSSFNTQNVNTMEKMFYNCSSLKEADLSSFNVIKANLFWMFKGCKNLFSCSSLNQDIIRSFKEK